MLRLPCWQLKAHARHCKRWKHVSKLFCVCREQHIHCSLSDRLGEPGITPYIALKSATKYCKQPIALLAVATKRYAIVGGGFAGVAVAHHLSLQATNAHSVSVDLFDVAGLVSFQSTLCDVSGQDNRVNMFAHTHILLEKWHLLHQGAGGSGAAGGLLHPFSPKGKVRTCVLARSVPYMAYSAAKCTATAGHLQLQQVTCPPQGLVCSKCLIVEAFMRVYPSLNHTVVAWGAWCYQLVYENAYTRL